MPVGRRTIVAACIGALTVSCHDDAKRRSHDAEKRAFIELSKRLAEKEAAKQPIPRPRSPVVSSAAEPEPAVPTPEPASATAEETSTTLPRDAPWLADDPVLVGPPGPATAAPIGVVWHSRDGDVFVARLGPLSKSSVQSHTPLGALPRDAGPFALGYGPSLFQDFVYWISHGSLVRRGLTAKGAKGSLEILARDAFDGTRVGVPIAGTTRPLAKIPATVAYVVRPAKEDGPLTAKLWVEGTPSLVLTAEGNSAHSVSLVHTDDGVLAVSVQARMAMTPVHARHVHFDGSHPVLGDEVVAWVGGGIQPLTEMTVLPVGKDGLFGFIPHERSMKEFGIASLDIGMNPDMDTPTTWMLYPNGIDPAPVSAAHLCGEPVLLYATPEAAAPESPQEIVVRSLADASGARKERIGTARAFFFVSLAEVDGGALAVWVTEDGTFARTLRCPSHPK